MLQVDLTSFLAIRASRFRPQSSHASDGVVSSQAILNRTREFFESLRVSSVSREFSSITPNNDNYMDDNNDLFKAYFVSNAWFFICYYLLRFSIAHISLIRNYKENVISHFNVVYLEQPSKPLGQTFLV